MTSELLHLPEVVAGRRPSRELHIVRLSPCPSVRGCFSLSTPLRREDFTSFLRDQKKVWWLSHLAQACQQDLHSSWIECDEEHLTRRSAGVQARNRLLVRP
jgi:hypothetical protein